MNLNDVNLFKEIIRVNRTIRNLFHQEDADMYGLTDLKNDILNEICGSNDEHIEILENFIENMGIDYLREISEDEYDKYAAELECMWKSRRK